MRWNIDPTHSTAEFSVRHLMITNVKGRFGALAGRALDQPDAELALESRDASRDR